MIQTTNQSLYVFLSPWPTSATLAAADASAAAFCS